jgi:hypothetical protein
MTVNIVEQYSGIMKELNLIMELLLTTYAVKKEKSKFLHLKNLLSFLQSYLITMVIVNLNILFKK